MTGWEICTSDHLREIKPQASQWASTNDVRTILETPEIDMLLARNARTFLVDGKPEGVIGVWPYNVQSGTAWAVFSDEATKNGVALARGTRRWIEAVEERDNLCRIQAFIDSDNEIAIHWIEKLGFEREGLMRKAGHDAKDMWLYARIN